jgi:hypothetical protein
MDWFIYHLVDDVFTHYWYGVQSKIFGYIRSKKCEAIVTSVVFWARDISFTNVLLYLDGDDIAFAMSCNHPPKV